MRSPWATPVQDQSELYQTLSENKVVKKLLPTTVILNASDKISDGINGCDFMILYHAVH